MSAVGQVAVNYEQFNLFSIATKHACACLSRWLKYITDAADKFKDSNPLKTPPRVPRATRMSKPVMTMSEVTETCES